jgi:hypothetical protein
MFTLTAILATSILAADISIDQVLPENTIAFVSVGNMSDLLKNVEKTGAAEMLCNIAQAMGLSIGEEASETCPLTAIYSDWTGNVKEDISSTIPSGHAGWGLYPVVDYEVGSVGLGMLAIVELGDSAIGETMTDSFMQYSKTMDVEMESINISGRSIWVVQTEIELPTNTLPMSLDVGDFSHLYFAITDGYLLVGTEPEGFASLFSAIDGKPIEESLATNDIYDALMQRLDTDGDAKGGLLLTNLTDAFVQMDTSGMSMMILPAVKSLFGDIDGIAETVAFSPDEDVMASMKYAIHMGDGRNGLMGLISTNAPSAPIPSYVGDDTITYSQINIDFSKVVALVQEIVASNPMLLSMQVNPQMMEQIEAGLAMYMSTLGTTTHVISTGSAPYADDSVGFLMAVECIDENALSNVLSMTMPSMGATPNDFLGTQIFTMELGNAMMIPMETSFSIAIGGGYVFVGSQYSVENALRAIAYPKDSENEQGMNVASSMIDHEISSGWGYGDMSESMNAQIASMQNYEGVNDQLLMEIEEFDPEMAAEMRAEAENSLLFQNELMETMATFLGKMAWNLDADETGFTSEMIMLKPAM